jgi:hypothetical protein
MIRCIATIMGALVALSCGAESRAIRPHDRPSLLETEAHSEEANDVVPGWRYHPSDAALLVARAPLPSGGALFAGQRGERWVVDARTGAAAAASDLAPEELVAIVAPGARRSGGEQRQSAWLFVGKSGTTYEASEPLGQFFRSSAPLQPLIRVREGGGVLMGLRRDGALARSDSAGAAWTKVGPDDAHFEDVALRDDGRGLALSIPEALYETRDYGATWQRSALGVLGATALVQDDAAGIVIQRALGPFGWHPERPDALSPLDRAVNAHAYTLGVPVPLGPSADALLSGRAVVVGKTLYEARPTSGLVWTLVTGVFGERLQGAALPTARGCETIFLAGFGSELYLACARQKGEDRSQPLEFQRSVDRGRSWTAEPYYVVGRTGEFSMAVGPGGTLVMTGICPAASHDAGCAPSGVHRRHRSSRDGGRELELVQSATPSLVRTAYELSFSSDGKTLYAMGRRFKSDSLAVFVSHDGGGTFEARDVETLRLPQDEDESRARFRADNPVRFGAAGADGTASFVVTASGYQYWLVVDDDGRPVSLVKPPIPNGRLGAAGAHALAVDPVSRDAYESLDAGANFKPIGRLPVDPCPGAQICDIRMACTPVGCVIGGVTSRVGWRTVGATGLSPESRDKTPRKREPRFGAPLSCTLGQGEWQKIRFALAAPTARDAAIGKTAWFAVAADAQNASGSVFHMKVGSSRLDEVPLLEASRAPPKDAMAVFARTGGGVAVRYQVPTGSTGPDLKHVELAWDDVVSGRTGHAIVDDAGPARPSDYGDGKGRVNPASIALAELAPDGVYLRVHGASGDDQTTLFLNGRTVESIPPVAWPAEVRQAGRSTMAHVNGVHVPLRVDVPAPVRAERTSGATWAFVARTLGWNNPREFGLVQNFSAVRTADRFGVHATTADANAAWAEGLLYPVRAAGAEFEEPIKVPTQLDLPAVPRACSNADRSSTPRVVVPYQPGTRHPVLVTDSVEPMRVMLTGDAVLQGTPSSPCALAYEAWIVPESASGQGERALIPVDTPERAWIFREGARDQPRSIEYRAMICRFDPAGEPPEEAKNQNGTYVESR